MSADAARSRFQRVEAIFRHARILDAAERDAYLAQACADDGAIHRQVRAMLRADARPEGFLDQAILGSRFDLSQFDGPDLVESPDPPERIGRYEVIRLIGRGGMGIVYEARQDQPTRSVALKVMHAGASAGRMLRRFRQEAQMLGRLQHPGIAQIFEAGVDDWGEGAQPYFAMELVRGRDLLLFARERNLSVRERVALLARICDAVHHAHQHGVIHRDLKPANVLVVDGEIDTDGDTDSHPSDRISAQPKILDFGVARLLDPAVSTTTLQTSAGQILGTVPYMSPEQAEGDTAAIDTRTDIYSLGVIAFELFADRHPHDLHGKPLHEALRTLRECEPPRLGTIDRRLRGDIETIVAKALERDKRDRFASAAEMGADLRRVLRHEPIQARRLGIVDQVRKFARRHRGLVAVAALACAALVAATAISVYFAGTAAQAESEQRRLRIIANERADAAERAAYQALLAAAAASLRAQETAEAIRQLESAPPARRGWEWAHLHSRIDNSTMAAALEAPNPIKVVFSAAGDELVVAGAYGELERRRSTDLALIASARLPIEGRLRRTTDLVRTGSGASYRLATLEGLFEIDATSLEPIGGGATAGDVCAADPEGRFIVRQSTTEHKTVNTSLMRLADGTTLARSASAESSAGQAAAAFSGDGRLAAFFQPDGEGLLVYAVDDGRLLLHRPDLRTVRRVRFSPDGSLLAAATGDGAVHLLPIEPDGRPVSIEAQRTGVSAMGFSPDGAHIATAARDGTVRCWSALDGRLISVFYGHEGPPNDLAYAADGATFVTICERDRTLRTWSTSHTGEPFVLGAPGAVYSLAFSPDGARLAAASLGGKHPIRVWEYASLVEIAAFGEGSASSLAFDSTGARLAVGRAHGDTTIVDSRDGTLLATCSRHWWRTDWLCFDDDDAHLLSVGNADSFTRHHAATGEVVRHLEPMSTDRAVGMHAALAPDGSRLAVAIESKIVLFDPETFTELDRFGEGEGPVHAIAFSPDGTRLATGGADRVIRIWDLAERRVLGYLEGHTDPVYAIAFSPDGRRIASGGVDRTVCLWESATFDQLVRLQGHAAFVHCLAWSPDGGCLASGGGDATVRLWETRPLREVVRARERSAVRPGD